MQEKEMSTTYQPDAMEKKWYKHWIEENYFEAGKDTSKQAYTIVIPPPNVTGKLHIGHALDFTIQDVLIRAKRMQGYDALWLPGSDHAGIATQTKVEQQLRTEENITRHELGRDAFLEKVWKWKDHYAQEIRDQWAKLGLSLDYTRERFTLDEGLSDAVKHVFVSLYERGLIYRGKYIINWDPVAKTALSDIEVEYKEVNGNLYHLNYPLKDGNGHLSIATTRPETMLGDTAVAVHPEDERYKHLIGKTLILPIVNREIPIIADHYVDPEFGSGAVKITPAHDPNDFEVGLRHKLPQIIVMNESGVMNEQAGPYQGLDRSDCRKKIVEDLERLGVLIKIEPHVHQVGHSERSGAVVEPYLSTQWFVKMEPLAEKALASKEVQFIPARFDKIYRHWIENVRDWCISRQLWWGHRIPAYYCNSCGKEHVAKDPVTICSQCQSSDISQDEDVLDTWFSSALWPFSTLGWPEETEDFKRYYPTNVLVTGYDIIYFWVARMIFTGLDFTKTMPFKDVFIHGLVRDAEGKKMSKSLGNGVDPIEIIEQYGADALRFMLCTGVTPGQDLRFRIEKVEQARNFANKIWNASRFIFMNLEIETFDPTLPSQDQLTQADAWILHRMNETVQSLGHHLERYEFGEMGRLLYNFVWDDFCDWYIEFAKLDLYGTDAVRKQGTQAVLLHVLNHILRMIHPFMPFISEEIWSYIPNQTGTITLAAWPTYNPALVSNQRVKEMNSLIEIIRSVRNLRAEYQVPRSKPITMFIKPKNIEDQYIFNDNEKFLTHFCKLSELIIDPTCEAPKQALTAVTSEAEIYLPLAELVDIEQEKIRLSKELEHLTQEVLRAEKKLGNQGFVAKAPAAVIEEEKRKCEDYKQKQAAVQQRLNSL